MILLLLLLLLMIESFSLRVFLFVSVFCEREQAAGVTVDSVVWPINI